jgi:hypothetical protein
MAMHVTRTGEGRWTVARRPTSEPLALIRDRELRDLVDALDAAIDQVTDVIVSPDGGKLSACEGEQISNTLDAAARYLRELRARQ